jgi:FAD synthase
MKTFKDLEFVPHSTGMGGVMSRIQFENGYGASVVCTPHTYGGDKGLYELAVLDSEGNLTYATSVTDDVIGYLRPEDVTDVMEKIQQL